MHFLDIDIYKVIYLNDSYYICNTNVIVYFPCMKLEEAQITKMQKMHKKRKRCKKENMQNCDRTANFLYTT